uniref:Uncharacterized protein n=1 Tax=Rhizophora mucronata TaxID=61149 RepID=A0A2P2P6C2_RHIMU
MKFCTTNACIMNLTSNSYDYLVNEVDVQNLIFHLAILFTVSRSNHTE